jgi:hypothetical protein
MEPLNVVDRAETRLQNKIKNKCDNSYLNICEKQISYYTLCQHI